MEIDPHHLPAEVNLLQQIVLQLLQAVEDKDQLVARLQHQLAQLLRYRYGQKRERIDENQLFLFAAQIIAASLQTTPTPSGEEPNSSLNSGGKEKTEKPERRGHGRKPLPKSLERRRVVFDLEESQQQCQHCHIPMQKIGEDESTIVPRKAAAPAETHASTPNEVVTILDVLKRANEVEPRQKLQAQTAIALMFFAGLRPGETRGARWDDYDGKVLSVERSVWRKHTTDPKTAGAAKPVLVIEPLRELLAQLHQIERNPERGPILRGVKGGPLDLNMLAKRVIRPALRSRKNYRDGKSKNWRPIEWQGFYSLRRGIATHLTAITRDPMAAKGLLRHSSVNTTLTHYIKVVPEVTASGMAQVEELFSGLDAANQIVQ